MKIADHSISLALYLNFRTNKLKKNMWITNKRLWGENFFVSVDSFIVKNFNFFFQSNSKFISHHFFNQSNQR